MSLHLVILAWFLIILESVDAIINVRVQYQLKRNWMGDPCSPKEYAWDGLKCSYDLNPPRITDV